MQSFAGSRTSMMPIDAVRTEEQVQVMMSSELPSGAVQSEEQERKAS
jgi:hypothetical protein